MKNRSLFERTGFALAGWCAAFKRERSFRAHAMVVVVTVIVLLLVRPEPLWWAFVALTCGLVLAIELVNSALEALADHLNPAIHPEIKAVKDMLAGAVLAVSLAAVVGAIAFAVAYWPELVGRWL